MKTAQSTSKTTQASGKPVKSQEPKATTPQSSLIEQQASQIEQLTNMVNMLMKTTDQGQLRRLQEKEGREIKPEVRLTKVGDKIVVHRTKLKTNKVRVHKGDIIEDQSFDVTYNDGTTEEWQLSDFTWTSEYTKPYKVKSTIVKDGVTTFVVDVDGEELEIESTFVN